MQAASPVVRCYSYHRWLDPKNADAEELQGLLVPYPAEEMAMRPVSTRVNSPRNEGPECIEGMTEGEVYDRRNEPVDSGQ